MRIIMALISLGLTAGVTLTLANGSQITDFQNKPLGKTKVIMAVIGEAADQSLLGQVAIVCGIKNRNSFQGVYGANITRTPSFKEVSKAERAYRMATPSFCYELIQGADAWENVKAFGQPRKWGAVYYVTTIEDHNFYRRMVSGNERYYE